jgi:hypothetical protein
LWIKGVRKKVKQIGVALFILALTKELSPYNISTIVEGQSFNRVERRSAYQDKCHHFNQLGNELIADRITAKILEVLDSKPPRSLK